MILIASKRRLLTLWFCLSLGKATGQAQEVQSGLWLLQQALNLLRTSMTNSDLTSHIDTTVGNLQSITNVLRSLNFQVSQYVSGMYV